MAFDCSSYLPPFIHVCVGFYLSVSFISFIN